SVDDISFKVVHDAKCILANWVDGVRACVTGPLLVRLSTGLIIVDTARFNLLGVLLKLNARPTLMRVLLANLKAFPRVPVVISLVSMSSCC
ncbi:hypothetical protein NL478_26825, partial [Klebsiella pneumoniae]|nr:hypothetical protein [Klebsiella pneumoniae]